MEQKGSANKVHNVLEVYREKGAINYKKSLQIPFDQRIPALVRQENGRQRVVAALSASILSAFGNIEKAKMTADQILDLADGIIDSAHEDDLSIEDVLLFLKELIMGKFGKITDKLDMPMFFELFEKYRTKRYQTLEAIRYEEHLNSKNAGHAPRSSSEITLNRDDKATDMLDLMQTMYGKED